MNISLITWCSGDLLLDFNVSFLNVALQFATSLTMHKINFFYLKPSVIYVYEKAENTKVVQVGNLI